MAKGQGEGLPSESEAIINDLRAAHRNDVCATHDGSPPGVRSYRGGFCLADPGTQAAAGIHCYELRAGHQRIARPIVLP